MKTISEQIWDDFVNETPKIFLVKTVSSFENVYAIEANSYAAAEARFHEDPPDFHQKHLKEDVYSIETIGYNINIHQMLTEQGYF